MTSCMDYAYSTKGPVYLRMGKSDRGDVHQGPIKNLDTGRLIKIRQGCSDRPGLIATGSMVRTAIEISNEQCLSVWSAPAIKPLSVSDICTAAKETTGLVTLEEHSVLGGLGSAVTEITSEFLLTRVLRIGVPDQFSELCGTHAYLLSAHGLDTEKISQRIKEFQNIL